MGVDPSRVVYVDDDAAEGGDGTQSRPLRDLGAALATVSDQGVVLLAAGTYPVRTTIVAPRRIIGVCARRVSLAAPPEEGPNHLLRVEGTAARLDLSGVSTPGQGDIAVDVRGGEARLHHVIARAGIGALLLLMGGRFALDEVWFHREREGYTMLLYATVGDASLRRVSATGSGAALYESESAVSRIDDSYAESWGVQLRYRSRARLARVVMSSRLRTLGLGSRCEADVEDVVLHGTLDVRDAAQLRGRRVRIEDGTLVATRDGSAVELSEVVVRFNGDAPRASANCISSDWGARTTLRHARIGPCWEAGVYSYLLGETTLEDSVVRDVRPDAEGLLGVGVVAALGGSATLRRTVVERFAMTGITAIHLQATVLRRLPLSMLLPEYGARIQTNLSRVSMEDAVIRDARRAPRRVSFGIAAGSNAEVTGERVALFGLEGAGVLATDSGFDRTTFVEGIARLSMLDAPSRSLLTAVLPPNLDGPSRVELRTTWIGPVRPAPVLWDPVTRETRADVLGAFGAFSSFGCSLLLRDAWIDGRDVTETGLAAVGALSITDGVVTRTTRCAAARSDAVDAMLELGATEVRGNVRDAVCTDGTLPAIRVPFSPN